GDRGGDRLLVPCLAAPEYGEACAAPEELGEDGEEEVDPLLLDEAADPDEERAAAVQPEPLYARRQLVLLSGPALLVVPRSNHGIRRRIPGAGVDPVQDPVEFVAPVTEQPIEPGAVLTGLDLLRVSRRDGDEAVAQGESALEERRGPVELDPLVDPE